MESTQHTSYETATTESISVDYSDEEMDSEQEQQVDAVIRAEVQAYVKEFAPAIIRLEVAKLYAKQQRQASAQQASSQFRDPSIPGTP